jgi:hypothetical protein
MLTLLHVIEYELERVSVGAYPSKYHVRFD